MSELYVQEISDIDRLYNITNTNDESTDLLICISPKPAHEI